MKEMNVSSIARAGKLWLLYTFPCKENINLTSLCSSTFVLAPQLTTRQDGTFSIHPRINQHSTDMIVSLLDIVCEYIDVILCHVYLLLYVVNIDIDLQK